MISYPLTDIWTLTYAELMHVYEAYLVNSWDHTSSLLTVTHNLTVVTCNVNSKHRQGYKSMTDFHPYRKKGKRQGVRKDNFEVFKHIGNAWIRNKG